MSVIDLEELSRELSSDEPCGENLEYDPEFLALEQAALGKPEVQYGDTVTPAVAPEWKVVKKTAIGLLGRTRDLRVAIPFLRSLLGLHGLVGFAEGLELIDRWLDNRWDLLHPQLDPDDDNDPILRLNTLAALSDHATVLRELKEATLVVLPGLGPLTLRTLEISSGEMQPGEGEEKISPSSLAAALLDVQPEQLEISRKAAIAAYDFAIQIEKTLENKVGTANALNLDALTKHLKKARDFLAAGDVSQADAQQASDLGAPAGAGAPAPGRASAGAALSGEILDRSDVLRAIDKICSYYQRVEPSSPVPMLLERAKRLATKNFFEIMEDMAPDGLAQVSLITGIQREPEY